MVLEATVLCLDSSEFMRNGDFQPTRLQAQRDAANLVVGTKLRDNPESTVGLLSMGQKIDVLSTLTRDKGKVLACLHDIQPTGACDFVSGIQVGQLILKHRQSKNHRQRIIVFVGSPVQATEKQLVQLAKKLKKSNVSVDVISFGEEDTNQSKLEAFISTVNKEDNSHLVVVPSGSGRLSDSIMSSPMFAAESAPAGPSGGMGDMDLDNDPELAMALRISLEEERQRQREQGGGEQEAQQQQEQEQQQEGAQEAQPEQVSASATSQPSEQPAQSSSQAQGGAPNFDAMTEEEMLQYAMQMSLQEHQAMDTGADEPAAKASKPEAEGEKKEGEDAKKKEEEAAKKKEEEEKKEPPKDEAAEGAMDIFQDPAYLSSVLGDLPGVDPSDTQVQEMLASLSKQDDEKKKEGEEKEKKDDKDKQ